MKIKSSKLSSVNKQLEISTADAPEFGANHVYQITLAGEEKGVIKFQRGPSQEHGVNGITDEALLSIVIHRLQGFQSGPLSCRENAIALTHIETALLFLEKRTQDRIERGVEGYDKA